MAITFKNSPLVVPQNKRAAGGLAQRVGRGGGALFGTLAALLLCGGCHFGSVQLPASDLRQPGWTVRQGQAVWRLGVARHTLLSPKQAGLDADRAMTKEVEIAGEVLVGTNVNGDALVQFSKPPFTLVVGRLTPTRWEVSFPPQNRSLSGPGAPPKQIIWLYLPRVLAGAPPPANWTWRQDARGWKLEDRITGEFVEGYLSE